MATKARFYAYILLKTGKSGIATSWTACAKLVAGQPARYRGFALKAAAEKWLAAGAHYEVKEIPKLEQGIYFDAGTGRGKGVEVKVTDEKGKSLLADIVPPRELTEFDTLRLLKGKTNNYGELLGCFYALQLALTKKISHIFGDSRLVITFWSKGFLKKDKVSKETHELVKEVKALRQQFEAAGGTVGYISGDFNPADLGFHR